MASKDSKTIDILVLLPQMGESVSEATLIEWYKKPGEKIAQDEIFVLIGTDKVESELPSNYAGVLKEILVQEKEDCAVGQPICIIEVNAADVSEADIAYAEIPSNNSTVLEDNLSKSNTYDGSKSFLSPVVRKIATAAGLELSELEKIQGSGAHGRIRKKDILAYLSPVQASKESRPHTATHKLDLQVNENDTVETLSRMQQLLANHLQQSFMEIPHVTTFAEVDVTPIVLHREEIKKSFVLEHGTKLTYTHYLQYAIIMALQQFPKLNAWMNVDELVVKKDINIGFATSLANGDLIVPNVKQAQKYTFYDWVAGVNEKAKKAKSGKLNKEDLQQTTFTVSNTGMFGSLAGTPIISKPQVGVIALGQILSAPGVVKVNGEEIVAVRKKMMLSISYDHRVINGAYASQFLMEIKNNLNNYMDWF